MAEPDPDRGPDHVAIVMDGNGRWAAARDLSRTAGHAAGEHSLFDVVEGALELGIKWLTVYTFSTENWTRAEGEVEYLMKFNESLLLRRRDEVNDLGVRVHFIGLPDDDRVPFRNKELMAETEAMTAGNTEMRLVFAFDYGGRAEIVDAARRIAREVAAGDLDPDDVDEKAFAARLYLPEMPDPDLIIRTSGEMLSIPTPAARCVSATSCCGRRPTPSSCSPRCCGPTSTAAGSPPRWRSSGVVPADSALRDP